MKRRTKVFTLPGQENEIDDLVNDELVEVVEQTPFPCPKEGIILVYIKYDDYNERGVF